MEDLIEYQRAQIEALQRENAKLKESLDGIKTLIKQYEDECRQLDEKNN